MLIPINPYDTEELKTSFGQKVLVVSTKGLGKAYYVGVLTHLAVNTYTRDVFVWLAYARETVNTDIFSFSPNDNGYVDKYISDEDPAIEKIKLDTLYIIKNDDDEHPLVVYQQYELSSGKTIGSYIVYAVNMDKYRFDNERQRLFGRKFNERNFSKQVRTPRYEDHAVRLYVRYADYTASTNIAPATVFYRRIYVKLEILTLGLTSYLTADPSELVKELQCVIGEEYEKASRDLVIEMIQEVMADNKRKVFDLADVRRDRHREFLLFWDRDFADQCKKHHHEEVQIEYVEDSRLKYIDDTWNAKNSDWLFYCKVTENLSKMVDDISNRAIEWGGGRDKLRRMRTKARLIG